MPDTPFHMDLALLEQCYLYLQITGHAAHPMFIQSFPAHYLPELAMFGQGVRFFEDAAKRRAAGMEFES